MKRNCRIILLQIKKSHEKGPTSLWVSTGESHEKTQEVMILPQFITGAIFARFKFLANLSVDANAGIAEFPFEYLAEISGIQVRFTTTVQLEVENRDSCLLRILDIKKEIIMEDTETCPRCEGTGKDPTIPSGHLRAQLGPDTCILCRGEKIIPKGKTGPDPIFPIIRLT